MHTMNFIDQENLAVQREEICFYESTVEVFVTV